jgi:hypothetical protein
LREQKNKACKTVRLARRAWAIGLATARAPPVDRAARVVQARKAASGGLE